MALLYIDSSSLLKILWEELESSTVREIVAREEGVVVSSLAELETEVQLRTKWLGGAFNTTRYQTYRKSIATLRGMDPFDFRELVGAVFRHAIEQHTASERVHCRSLDRLHLAAMNEFQIRRLLTNDIKQATAARALGFEVVFAAPQ